MPIRESISLYKRYLDDRLLSKDVFKTYYLIMEGTNTEPIYFKLFKKKLSELKLHNNIKLIFLERTINDRGHNSPKQLLNYIVKYRNEVNDENAKYLIVFDRDSYKSYKDGKAKYFEFLKLAKKENVDLIVTSPCFEIWLLLHKENAYEDLIKPHKEEIFLNKKVNKTQTFISKMVYDNLHFNPKSEILENLLDKLDIALMEAKYLTQSVEKMADEIGENVSVFINNILKDPRE